jgi:DNA-binding NarL/FixJ family response regulator
MLRGGEYFPAGMFHSYTQRIRDNFEALSPRLGSSLAPAAGSKLPDLTAREIQILARVSRGLQNKAIAAEFNLSEHTVKVHLHNIITKLGARNRTDAAARFLEREAVPLNNINLTPNWTASREGVTNGAEQEF